MSNNIQKNGDVARWGNFGKTLQNNEKTRYTDKIQLRPTESGLELSKAKSTATKALGRFAGRQVKKFKDQLRPKQPERNATHMLLGYNNKTSKNLYDFVVSQKGETIANKLLQEKYFKKTSWTKQAIYEVKYQADLLEIEEKIQNAKSLEELYKIELKDESSQGNDFLKPTDKQKLEDLKAKTQQSIIESEYKIDLLTNYENLDNEEFNTKLQDLKDKKYNAMPVAEQSLIKEIVDLRINFLSQLKSIKKTNLENIDSISLDDSKFSPEEIKTLEKAIQAQRTHLWEMEIINKKTTTSQISDPKLPKETLEHLKRFENQSHFGQFQSQINTAANAKANPFGKLFDIQFENDPTLTKEQKKELQKLKESKLNDLKSARQSI